MRGCKTNSGMDYEKLFPVTYELCESNELRGENFLMNRDLREVLHLALFCGLKAQSKRT